MIRHAPERRYKDRTLWREPVLLEAEIDDYRPVDRLVEAGASCRGCGRALTWPLLQLPCGFRRAPVLLHPECAVAMAEGIVRDVVEIEEGEGF